MTERGISPRIVFMGTPEFAVPSLERLIAEGYVPVAVVTAPDKPRGRGQKVLPTPVKEVALAHGIPVLQPPSVKAPEFVEEIARLAPDIIAVVAFKILPPEVYEQARLGAFNLHASLLPAFRGAAPIQRALMAGVTETGVTTFLLKEKVDTGDMLLQVRTPVGEEETAGELHDRLKKLGAEAVLQTVRMLESGKVEPVPQPEEGASLAPKIRSEDLWIPWHKPAREVHNHIRALSPYPGARTLHGDRLIKIYRTRVTEGEGEPGEIIEAGKRLVVACGEGAVEVLELQREGHRRLPTPEFLKGYPLRVGERFVSSAQKEMAASP